MPYAAAATCISSTTTTSRIQLRRGSRSRIISWNSISFNQFSFSSAGQQSLSEFFFRSSKSSHGPKRNSIVTGTRPFSPVMEWQDCAVKMDVDVPSSVAYKCYSDREAVPRWMPFISSVEVLKDTPDLSRWSLKYKAFGRDLEFSWLAKNLQPIPNQKIHWRSLDGFPNRGAVRFYPRGPSSCTVELTISYQVPLILTPVAPALQPFLRGLLLRGLEEFVKVAEEYEVA